MKTKEEIKKVDMEKPSLRKSLTGKVVSDKMTNTVVVAVDRYSKHPVYGKYRKITKRYKADLNGMEVSLGDKVVIESCKPISKEKYFKVINKI